MGEIHEELEAFVQREMKDRKPIRFDSLDEGHVMNAVSSAVEVSRNIVASGGPHCLILNTEAVIVLFVCIGTKPAPEEMGEWVEETVLNISTQESNVRIVVFVYWASEFHLGYHVRARSGESEIAERVQDAVDKTVAASGGVNVLASDYSSKLN
jgi:hypothetical protein